MTTKNALELVSSLIGVVGTSASMWGTFLLTRFYHTFSARDVLRVVARWTGAFLLFHSTAVAQEARGIAALSSITEEKKAISLVGIYWVFVGFLLQGASLLLLTVDVLLDIFATEAKLH